MKQAYGVTKMVVIIVELSSKLIDLLIDLGNGLGRRQLVRLVSLNKVLVSYFM